MTKEEYRKRMDEDNEWAPGWDAIEAEFDRLYPGKEPLIMVRRFTREQYLAGIIILTDIPFMIREKVISI